MEGEFQDWELLHNSVYTSVKSPDSVRSIDETEGDTGGMIRSDYFSLENQDMYAKTDELSEEGSVHSDNPGWIDPGSDTRYVRKTSDEFWSDSGSDLPDESKLGDSNSSNVFGLVDNVKPEAVSVSAGGIEVNAENSEKFVPDESIFNYVGAEDKSCQEGNVQTLVGYKELIESESGEKGSVAVKTEDIGMRFDDHMKKREDELISVESRGDNCPVEEELDGDGERSQTEDKGVVAVAPHAKEGGEQPEKSTVVWWKVPFEVLKYCMFKVSPVWSFSVAAAVMGFVILGHKLYKLKRETRGLHLKVTVEDDKAEKFTHGSMETLLGSYFFVSNTCRQKNSLRRYCSS